MFPGLLPGKNILAAVPTATSSRQIPRFGILPNGVRLDGGKMSSRGCKGGAAIICPGRPRLERVANQSGDKPAKRYVHLVGELLEVRQQLV